MSDPITVICTFRVKENEEEAFTRLLERHWPTLKKLGLATDEPAVNYKGTDKNGKTFFVEIFSWKDDDSPRVAHESPEVMAIWEPMGTLCEERDGRPSMEFPHVERMKIEFANV